MKLEKGGEGVNMGREKLPRFQTLQRSYEKAVQLLPPCIEKETETRDMPYVTHQAHIFFLLQTREFMGQFIMMPCSPVLRHVQGKWIFKFILG